MTQRQQKADDGEYAGPWRSALVECVICNRKWAAVYPAACERLECPGCGYMNSAPPTEGAE